ncbi:hypothetical protein CC86DRAFT_431540 [Ophiobolus disseminans]|uniref:Uncharacterized protein n=1 Tax=Ophiobolus disseminans TaxID=1469910 RepID=A0A6A7AG49_9PLEO|nr:hypothetical protein CC86DRAFT_431540 [Ophiobolus disseminans]
MASPVENIFVLQYHNESSDATLRATMDHLPNRTTILIALATELKWFIDETLVTLPDRKPVVLLNKMWVDVILPPTIKRWKRSRGAVRSFSAVNKIISARLNTTALTNGGLSPLDLLWERLSAQYQYKTEIMEYETPIWVDITHDMRFHENALLYTFRIYNRDDLTTSSNGNRLEEEDQNQAETSTYNKVIRNLSKTHGYAYNWNEPVVVYGTQSPAPLNTFATPSRQSSTTTSSSTTSNILKHVQLLLASITCNIIKHVRNSSAAPRETPSAISATPFTRRSGPKSPCQYRAQHPYSYSGLYVTNPSQVYE